MTEKPRKKINRFKLIIIIVIIVVGVLFLLKPSFARYIYNGIKNYYYESQSFYFNCNKLSEGEDTIIQIDNWDGVNKIDIDYVLNSFKNNSIASPSDITYDITKHRCVTTADVTCTITKESGLVSSNTHSDLFTITVTPNSNLNQGDKVRVEVEVISRSPYEKKLTGVAILNVGVPGISYAIVDKVNSPYLDYNITNTLNYYRVVTAFGNYNPGATINQDVYDTLSAENKAKCTSALIRLSFNPNVILVDVTSDFYDNTYASTTQIINGKAYINSVTFGVDPVSSISIRFYKADVTNNYTYPTDDNNNSPIITFQALDTL